MRKIWSNREYTVLHVDVAGWIVQIDGRDWLYPADALELWEVICPRITEDDRRELLSALMSSGIK